MVSTIPVTNDTTQKMRVILNGQVVAITLHWSSLFDVWTITVDGVASGVQVTSGEPLASVAGGQLRALALRGVTTDPGREGWGDTHALAFLDG